MRFIRFSFSLLAVIMLTACTASAKKEDGWVAKTEKTIEDVTGYPIPTGYAGARRLLKPPVEEAEAVAEVSWNEIDNYNVPPAMPTEPMAVYPTDGMTTVVGSNYGSLMQQVFFLYGSDRIAAGAQAELGNLAASLMQTQYGALSVTVVGHASEEVKGIADPVRRKAINFEMAQKRANAVMGVLTAAGLNPVWVQVVSKGDEEPNMNPGDKPQELADRRVEVFVAGQ